MIVHATRHWIHVRSDEPDLHFCFNRSLVAVRVAKVAPVSFATERPDWSGHAAQVLPEADEIPQHLTSEDRGALQQRVVFTSAGFHRTGEDGATQRGSRSPWEGGVHATDRLEHVGVRGTDSWEAELLRQPLNPRPREGAEDRGIEGLQGIGAAGRVTIAGDGS